MNKIHRKRNNKAWNNTFLGIYEKNKTEY